MSMGQDARQWWLAALLGQAISAHPVFGSRIHVAVTGDTVTLTGRVSSADEATQIEEEAHGLDMVEHVVNHLQVVKDQSPYHLQTVIAVFPDCRTARLAQQAMAAWTFHDDEPAEIFEQAEDARRYLLERARAASVPGSAVDEFLHCMGDTGALIVDTVPEDDALRIVSALEGTRALRVGTLPPEPGAVTRS